MFRVHVILLLIFLATPLAAQRLSEFQPDTSTYLQELALFETNVPEEGDIVLEQFRGLYASLTYEQRMDVIGLSNQMLRKGCRPSPHFITFQKTLLVFFEGDKLEYGYPQWADAYSKFLDSDQALLQNIQQCLKLTSSILEENVFFKSTAVTWRALEPSFNFTSRENMAIDFKNVTLVCNSGSDSIIIHEASGYIDPVTMNFVGTKGKVKWERAGRSEQEMYARLMEYSIDLRNHAYEADSAMLYYPTRFPEGIDGILEDKVSAVRNPRSASFPRFESRGRRFRLESISPGINYMGGFSVEGAGFVGTGSKQDPAVIELYASDTLRLRARSARFDLDERVLGSNQAEVSIYFGKDSIFHPALVFNYDVSRELLRLNKSEDFTSKGPYSNSYHGIDMNFEELSWKRGDPLINMQAQAGAAIGRATFESNTFFNYGFYESLQGMDYANPLAQLAAYSREVNALDFFSGPYSEFIGFAEYQVRHQLMAMAQLGFLYFDDESDMIILRQKLFDYLDAATRKRDYDVIRFNSTTQGMTNATLDLDTRDLTIRGIPVIFLSDSQNVRLVPRENSIRMKKNRSFEFDGVVDAGLFRFRGRDFYFDYDSFKIDLKKIDSLELSINTGDLNEYGDPILTKIDNAIEDMTGVLLIDSPDNKSGLKRYPGYPTFDSHGNSFIYFDRPDIQNGVYKRENFYFKLDAFSVDSLDKFNANSISPGGIFYSAGILPPMEMNMTLREDNSLGFFMDIPEEGIDIYGGVGKFFNNIEMSSRGLHGYGSMDFLSSTTWSDDFLLHPDSMMTRSRRYLLREVMGMAIFPYVENSVTDVTLYPVHDSMAMLKVEENFKIFNDSVWHSGDLALTPMGLTGQGAMGTDEALLESEAFTYETSAIYADSAGVKLRASINEDFSFETNDVSIYVDMVSRKGEFRSRGENSRVDMTYNMYRTELDSMYWDMDAGTLMMAQTQQGQADSIDIGIDSLKTAASPVFTSTHPKQEDLNFISAKAVYDYRAKELTATRVPFIKVADAFIFPNAGRVKIGKQASMSALENAKILANQDNRKHLVYAAAVNITGARDYTGTGTYSYRDASGNEYPIFFNRIWVDSSRVSQAIGEVDAGDPFMISPHFDFRGDVRLNADLDFLTFDGGVQLVHDCSLQKSWMRFTALINPSDIRIPVAEQMLNTDLNKIFAGSMITRDSTHIYGTYLSGRKDYFDTPLTQARGILTYEGEERSYKIAGEDKLTDPEVSGDLLVLRKDDCVLQSEGAVNLNLGYGQVMLKTVGESRQDVGEDKFETHLLMGIDFMFSEEALKVMGAEIDSLPSLEPVDLTTRFYRMGMKNLLGDAMAVQLETELGLTGAYETIPPEWQHTLFFNDLPLSWNQESRSFRYKGKVGIGNIGNIQVNKKVDAYVEFVEKGSGDMFDIYLRVDQRTWYYLAYSPGGLQVLSSNKAFNDIVFNLKVNDRRIKGGVGVAPYVYSLAAQRRMELFIDRFLEFEEEGGDEAPF